jgi:hypothetical protein
MIERRKHNRGVPFERRVVDQQDDDSTIAARDWFKGTKADPWPECEAFYNLMQLYRHMPITRPNDVQTAYREIKDWLHESSMKATAFEVDVSTKKLARTNEELRAVLRAAIHALRSYEYGNASPDLAKEAAADKFEEALKRAEEE